MSRIRQSVDNNRGHAIMKFALILPLLMLLLAGILDFGLIFSRYLTVAAAAREGARSAALGGSDLTAIAAVKNVAHSISPGQLVITVCPAVRESGNSVTVVVSSPVQTVTPFIGTYLAPNFAVRSEAVMRVQ